jgi:hypothetical protein
MNKDLRGQFMEQLINKAEEGIVSLEAIDITSKDYGMVTMNISNSIAIANELKAQIQFDKEMAETIETQNTTTNEDMGEEIPEEFLERMFAQESVEMGVTEEGDVE